MTRMRKLSTTTAAAAVILTCMSLSTQTAQASEIGRSRKFGVGGMLGAPTGLSLKLYFNPRHALDFGVGIGWWGGAAGYLHVDYKYHFMLTRTRGFDLPLYIGVGAKFTVWFANRDHYYWGDSRRHGGYFGFGVRVPLGIAFNLNRLPLDVFLEIVPGVGVFPGIGAFLDGAIGVRYYF